MATETAPVENEEQIGGKILVVDDEVNIVELLTGWLETIGCEVVSASNGGEALEQARKHHPDLILMDCMMPEVSGFDACKKLKQDDELKDIPVIFLTVRNEVKDVVEGLDLGAHGYMTKPFKPQELLARVRSVLRIKKLQDRLRSRTKELRSEWSWVRAVMEDLPAGVLVLDDEQTIVYINRTAQVRTGVGQANGQPAAEVFCFAETKDLGDIWGSSEELQGHCRFGPLQGDHHAIELRARPLTGDEVAGQMLLLIFQD